MAPKLLHLRSTTPNKRPDPALMLDGQTAQNQAVESPGTFIKLADGTLSKVGPTHVGATAPNATPAGTAGNSAGESWLDTSVTPPVLRVWSGTAWEAAVTPATVPNATTTVRGIAELATQAEVDAGTNNTFIVTPSTLRNGVLGPIAKHTDVSDVPATSGQALMWDGTQWAPTDVPAPEQTVVIQTTPLNLYVATTGNDLTGDGTQALPYATPHRAMVELSHLVLAADVTATVNVAAGDYTLTTPLNVTHPNATQITIVGAALTGTRPTTSLTGNGVKGNTAAAATFNLNLLTACYTTRLCFNGCSGILAVNGPGCNLQNLLIRGDGVTTAASGINIGTGGTVQVVSGIAVHHFGNSGVFGQRGSVADVSTASITNCGYGIYTLGVTTASGCVVSNNTNSGAQARAGAQVTLTSAYTQYNGIDGVNCEAGGSCEGTSPNSSYNAGDGFAGDGVISASSAISTWNTGDGIRMTEGGQFWSNGVRILDNGGTAVTAIWAQVMIPNWTSVARNAGGGLYAQGRGCIKASSTITGNVGGTGNYSPAHGTVGNGQAYIGT